MTGPGRAKNFHRQTSLGPQVRSKRPRRAAKNSTLVAGLLLVASFALIIPIAALDAPARQRALIHVHISGFAFLMSPTTITEGDEIEWHNHDGVDHTSTSDAPGWTTGNIAPGGVSAPVTFSTAGTYPYHCAIHLGMTGSVIVNAGAPELSAAAVLPALAMLLFVGLLIAREREARVADPL